MLAQPEAFRAALAAIAAAAARERVLVVPGGGAFADAVRGVDARLGLSAGTAHWMAVLAIDQYALLVAERLDRGVLVEDPPSIAAAFDAARIPVLAPSAWLRRADPLPHSWDVTSDSIAAWVAGAVGAPRLVLIKPAGSTGDLVDAYFERALPDGVTSVAIPADQLHERGDLR